MGWVESSRTSNRELVQAIKDVRAHFGESQHSFAERLGLSTRAIANYEKDRRPTATVLARLAKVASDANLRAQVTTFMLELWHDLGLDLAIQAGESAYARGVEAGRDLQALEDAKVTCPACMRGGDTVDMERRFHFSEVDGLPSSPCRAWNIRRARPSAFTEPKP
jgi:transcriptional regulator with XRE-family HTH domain